ncbi:hypothetical protein DKM19_31995 [Streptosporangium sp. 'caverna']|nr:hypothetical protein DKM19_31995 [Streptosporangium sp. 'caverna']
MTYIPRRRSIETSRSARSLVQRSTLRRDCGFSYRGDSQSNVSSTDQFLSVSPFLRPRCRWFATGTRRARYGPTPGAAESVMDSGSRRGTALSTSG